MSEPTPAEEPKGEQAGEQPHAGGQREGKPAPPRAQRPDTEDQEAIHAQLQKNALENYQKMDKSKRDKFEQHHANEAILRTLMIDEILRAGGLPHPDAIQQTIAELRALGDATSDPEYSQTADQLDEVIKQYTQQGEEQGKQHEEEGLPDKTAQMRLKIEAAGVREEDIDRVIRFGQDLEYYLYPGKEIPPELLAERDNLVQKYPELGEIIGNVAAKAVSEELKPPPRDIPDDVSELTGEQHEAEEDPVEAQRQRKYEESIREAQEAFEDAVKHPEDAKKQERMHKTLMEARKHHAEHGAHGAEGLGKKGAKEYWSKVLTGLGVAFYLYIAAQYLVAEAVNKGASGGK